MALDGRDQLRGRRPQNHLNRRIIRTREGDARRLLLTTRAPSGSLRIGGAHFLLRAVKPGGTPADDSLKHEEPLRHRVPTYPVLDVTPHAVEH